MYLLWRLGKDRKELRRWSPIALYFTLKRFAPTRLRLVLESHVVLGGGGMLECGRGRTLGYWGVAGRCDGEAVT